jgi:hypothetical protein
MGQRASYGIDGGFAGLAVFGTVGAALAARAAPRLEPLTWPQ